MIEFLIIQLFPTNTFLNRMEFSTVPFIILPLATKLFFTKITVEDNEGHLHELPDVIEQYFPACKSK